MRVGQGRKEGRKGRREGGKKGKEEKEEGREGQREGRRDKSVLFAYGLVLSHQQIQQAVIECPTVQAIVLKQLSKVALWLTGLKTTSGMRTSALSFVTSLLHSNILTQETELQLVTSTLEIAMPTACVQNKSLSRQCLLPPQSYG